MQPHKIQPDLLTINKYFRLFDTKKTYYKQWRDSEKLAEVKYPFYPPYEEYLKFEKESVLKSMEKYGKEIDFEEFILLIERKNLKIHFDDIYFIMLNFKQSIGDKFKAFQEPFDRRKEYYKILKYLLLYAENPENTEIKFLNKEKDKNLLVAEPYIVKLFLMNAREFIVKELSNFQYDPENFVKPQDVTIRFVEERLSLHQNKKRGRKKEIDPKIPRYLSKFLYYLHNETPLKLSKSNNISSSQGDFIGKLLGIFKIIDIELIYQTKPDEYVRSLLSNFKNSTNKRKTSI